MRYLLFFLLAVPLVIAAQRQKDYALDLSDQSVTVVGLSFNVTKVVDRTGIEDGVYGQVYTGLLNNGRSLTMENGLELNLLACLLRSIQDPSLPKATLEIEHLRIEEQITMTSEQRKLRLVASLSLPGDGGAPPQRYGPVQVTSTKGGLEVTSGHPAALAEGLGEALAELDKLVRAGQTSEERAEDYDPLVHELPDGALYSVTDYRAGRVDTSFRLQLVGLESLGTVDGLSYHRAVFERPQRETREQYRELWGYHHDGRTFQYVQKNFYELRYDREDRAVVVVPGGLVDPEEMTKRAAFNGAMFGVVGAALTNPQRRSAATDVYQLDLQSGALSPIVPQIQHERLAHDIILHHASESADYVLTIEIEGKSYTVPAGTYLPVDHATSIVLTAGHGKAQPYYRDIAPYQSGEPTLYRMVVDAKGRIKFTRENQTIALAAAKSIDDGQLPAAVD